jgi:very-short-patch-repair endonuclease
MRNFDADVAASRGLVTTAQLRSVGYTDRHIAQLVATGRASRPRRGWIATPDAPADAVRAVSLGGRLGGASALASYGVWLDEPPEFTVVCKPTASRLPPVRGEKRLWLPDRFAATEACRWRVSVLDALLQFSRSAPRDSLIAAVDSALQTRAIRQQELAALHPVLPVRLRSIIREVDGSAMSGTETHMRLALARAGYRVESQVDIPGVGTVDLVIDGWLIVELDSRAHHQSPAQQNRDRQRDGNAVLLGFGHERFMWSQVRYSIEWCLDVVAARLKEGRPSAAGFSRSDAQGSPLNILMTPRRALTS